MAAKKKAPRATKVNVASRTAKTKGKLLQQGETSERIGSLERQVKRLTRQLVRQEKAAHAAKQEWEYREAQYQRILIDNRAVIKRQKPEYQDRDTLAILGDRHNVGPPLQGGSPGLGKRRK